MPGPAGGGGGETGSWVVGRFFFFFFFLLALIVDGVALAMAPALTLPGVHVTEAKQTERSAEEGGERTPARAGVDGGLGQGTEVRAIHGVAPIGRSRWLVVLD